MTTLFAQAKPCRPKQSEFLALKIETQEMLDALLTERPEGVWISSSGLVHTRHCGVSIEVGDWIIWDPVEPNTLEVYEKDSIFEYVDFI